MKIAVIAVGLAILVILIYIAGIATFVRYRGNVINATEPAAAGSVVLCW